MSLVFSSWLWTLLREYACIVRTGNLRKADAASSEDARHAAEERMWLTSPARTHRSPAAEALSPLPSLRCS